jgi:hypothetical protein
MSHAIEIPEDNSLFELPDSMMVFLLNYLYELLKIVIT